MQITKGEIKIQMVEGSHSTIMDNDKVATAINEAIISIIPIKKQEVMINNNNMTPIPSIHTRM